MMKYARLDKDLKSVLFESDDVNKCIENCYSGNIVIERKKVFSFLRLKYYPKAIKVIHLEW